MRKSWPASAEKRHPIQAETRQGLVGADRSVPPGRVALPTILDAPQRPGHNDPVIRATADGSHLAGRLRYDPRGFRLHGAILATLLFAGVVALLALLAAVSLKVREARQEDGEEPRASDLLTDFREMHSKGVLDDAEYRTIKAKLTEQIQQELKDSDETG